MTRAMWTNEEIELLKNVYSFKTANQLREIFPQYTREQVYRKAKQLKLKKDELVAKQSRVENAIIQRQDLWTDDEIRILYEFYPEFGAEGVRLEFQKQLNKDRLESAIVTKANHLHLTRSQKNILNWTIEDVKFETSDSFSVTLTFKGW